MLADALGLGESARADLLAAARPEVATAGSAVGERSSPPRSLPLPPTRLIGRETEVAALSGLLAQDGVRLVTLTGPGGTGKTRLAQEVAAQMRDRYRGRRLVRRPLPADRCRPRRARPSPPALGVRRGRRSVPRREPRPLPGRRRLLLVLDNCEQVLEAAPIDRRAARGLPATRDPGHQPRAVAHPRRAGVSRRCPCRCRTADSAGRRPIWRRFPPSRCSSSAPTAAQPDFRLTEDNAGRRRRHLPSPRRPAAGHRVGRRPGQSPAASRAAGPPRAAAAAADRRRPRPARPAAHHARRHRLELRPARRRRSRRCSGAWPSSPAASRSRRRRR